MERAESIDRVALTVPEVAQALGIGLSSAYELVHRADFPAFRIGRAVRVSRARLNDWVNAQAEGGGQV